MTANMPNATANSCKEARRSRSEQRHREEARQNQRAGDVRGDVEAPHSRVRDRRDDGADRNDAAEPDRECEDIHVPQRDHRLIII